MLRELAEARVEPAVAANTLESPKGVASLRRRLSEVLEDAENELSAATRALLASLGDELQHLNDRVATFDAQIRAIAQAEPRCRRLSAIPGIGPLTATALVGGGSV